MQIARVGLEHVRENPDMAQVGDAEKLGPFLKTLPGRYISREHEPGDWRVDVDVLRQIARALNLPDLDFTHAQVSKRVHVLLDVGVCQRNLLRRFFSGALKPIERTEREK